MPSLRAQRAVVILGRNVKRARLARGLAMSDLAERANVSPKTIQRLERGDAGVGVGNLAAVLVAFGAPDALAQILRIEDDAVGLSRALDAIPKRGRSHTRRSRAGRAPGHDEASVNDDEGVGF